MLRIIIDDADQAARQRDRRARQRGVRPGDADERARADAADRGAPPRPPERCGQDESTLTPSGPPIS